jgi:GNAT superfamily N-acetyltransferase
MVQVPAAELPPGFTSRPYEHADAKVVAALHSMVFSISPSTVDSQLSLPGLAFARVVERDGQPVAFLSGRAWAAGHTGCRILVQPEVRGLGLGAALLRQATGFLGQVAPAVLRTAARDDDTASVGWALRRGFVEVVRSLSLTRDPTETAEQLDEAAAAAATKAGVRLTSWSASPTDADWGALTDLLARADEGDPDSGAGPIDEGSTRFLVPHPEGAVLAVRGGVPVGLASIAPQGNGVWYSWYTGVVPQERGRGTGRALKRRALAVARRGGATSVQTDNDAINEPVLRLNESLGYRQHSGIRWLHAELPPADLSGPRCRAHSAASC